MVDAFYKPPKDENGKEQDYLFGIRIKDITILVNGIMYENATIKIPYPTAKLMGEEFHNYFTNYKEKQQEFQKGMDENFDEYIKNKDV